jgi:hypothetical protein
MPRPPHINRSRFPQEQVFQNKLPFACSERLVADFAYYRQIVVIAARLSRDLVKRKAPCAAE